jgi:hypothetical protein
LRHHRWTVLHVRHSALVRAQAVSLATTSWHNPTLGPRRRVGPGRHETHEATGVTVTGRTKNAYRRARDPSARPLIGSSACGQMARSEDAARAGRR